MTHKRLELLSTILLAVAGVATAWAAYQSRQWTGEQSLATSKATATRIAEKGIRELPGTLGEAIDELEADPVIAAALGDHVLSHYVAAKRTEWDAYRTQVSSWELEQYLERF